MEMEDQFQVKIPDAGASKCVTVADLQNLIVSILIVQGRQPSESLQSEVWEDMMAVLAQNRYPVNQIVPQSKWVGDITRYG